MPRTSLTVTPSTAQANSRACPSQQLSSNFIPRCRVPLPYWRNPPDEVSANWHIGQPETCEYGCHLVIAELLAKLWTRYDIEQQMVQ